MRDGRAGQNGRLRWERAFHSAGLRWSKDGALRYPPKIHSLADCKRLLDAVHIRECLLKPYFTLPDYPLVETRELMPSFEADLWEYHLLPGFSLVVFARPLDYFSEVFQYDILHPARDNDSSGGIRARSMQAIQNRLPRALHERFREAFAARDVTGLADYPLLLPFLLEMDRAQVMSLTPSPAARAAGAPRSAERETYHLSGVCASFPSDLDTEIKRYGLRINKFEVGNSALYEKNRGFVLQHLLELYGFPAAVSERRTSAALFARRLHKMGEKFLIRVLGQSDRTISTIWSDGASHTPPKIEKLALVRLDPEQSDMLHALHADGYLVDKKKGVVLMRVRYRQHGFNPDNVRQERALSIETQEVIHPLTGETRADINILRDASNMFLRLNDIVRGEYTGRIIYKRNEIVENTDSEEKRLKFLCAWLSKHQRRMIGYGDEFFTKIVKVLDGYLFPADKPDAFLQTGELRKEVLTRYSYIQQARKVRLLEDLRDRQYKGERIGYARMLAETVSHLTDLKFEIVSYFDALVSGTISICEAMLNDAYLRRTYIEKRDAELTRRGLEIKKNYGRIVSLLDDFKAVRKARQDSQGAG